MNGEELAFLHKPPHTSLFPSFQHSNIKFYIIVSKAHSIYYNYISFIVHLVFLGGNNLFGFSFVLLVIYIYVTSLFPTSFLKL